MARVTVLVLLGLVVAAPGLASGVAYTALDADGVWRVYWRRAPTAQPVALQPGLTADASAPSLSPDGQRIAFEVQGGGLLICPLVARGACRTVSTPGATAVRPTWDPRSGEVVFIQYRATADGEESDLVVTHHGLEQVSPLVSHTGNQDDPDFSPDGRRLVYSSASTISLRQAGVQVVRQLWIMDLATGEARTLVPGAHRDQHPDWSPDGAFIAFASDRGGGTEIWVVGADGAGLRQVTSGAGIKTWPAWSPDGGTILFTRAEGGQEALWQVDVTSGATRPFLNGPRIARDADWR